MSNPRLKPKQLIKSWITINAIKVYLLSKLLSFIDAQKSLLAIISSPIPPLDIPLMCTIIIKVDTLAILFKTLTIEITKGAEKA